MNHSLRLCLLCCSTQLAFMPLAFGQLTIDQKTADFGALASLYAKRYGPYEWKRDALHFDLMEVVPWLSKVQATKDDLDFYEVLSEYVASLNDAHASYLVPSTFVARLNFGEFRNPHPWRINQRDSSDLNLFGQDVAP